MTSGGRAVPGGLARKAATAALIGLPLLFLGVLFYYPLGRLVWEALGGQGGLSGPGGPGTPGGEKAIDVVRSVASDPYFRRIFAFTLQQALYSTLLSAALGLPLAAVLVYVDFPGRNLVRSLTLVPFVLPTITVALGFILFFGNQGAFNNLLSAFTGRSLPILYSLQGIVLAHAFYNAPVVARTTLAAWERIDPGYAESARVLGAARWATFRTIDLPLLLPGLLTGALLAFIFSFMSFPIVLALGGARYTTIEVEVYTQVRVLLDTATGTALALFELVISLALAALYLAAEGAWGGERRSPAGAGWAGAGESPFTLVQQRPRQRVPFQRLGSAMQAGLLAFALFLAVLYGGPVLSVVFDSVTPAGSARAGLGTLGATQPAPASGAANRSGPAPSLGPLTLDAFATVLSPARQPLTGETPLRAVLNTLRFGAGTVALALPLGLALAAGLAWGRPRGRRTVEVLALAPLAVSSMAFGFGMLRASRIGPLQGLGSAGAIVAAHVVLALPFVLRSLRPALERLDPSLREAARTLGAPRWRAFVEVELPLLAAAVAVAGAFAFGISVSEMSATIMLARPGDTTMPLAVYHLLAARRFKAASAMAVLLILLAGAAFALIDWLADRYSGGRESAANGRAPAASGRTSTATRPAAAVNVSEGR